jgi:hypothetical protein
MTTTGKHWNITGVLETSLMEQLDISIDNLIGGISEGLLYDIFFAYSELFIVIVFMCFVGLYIQLLAYLIMQLILYFDRNRCVYSGLESTLPRIFRKRKQICKADVYVGQTRLYVLITFRYWKQSIP